MPADACSSPAGRRGRRASRAERRRSIALQVLEVLTRELQPGQHRTDLTVERLVKASGVSRTTFYVYFEDLNDVLIALADETIVSIQAVSGPWWQDLPATPGRDDLREALRPVFKAFFTYGPVMNSVIEAGAMNREVREQFDQLIWGSINRLADHMLAGQRSGYVRGDLDVPMVAAWLGWMMERGILSLAVPASEAGREAHLETETDIIWNVLYRGARG
jgi:AcrR family transcriptional regulator